MILNGSVLLVSSCSGSSVSEGFISSSGSEDAASIVLVLLSRAASFILVSAFVQPDTNIRKSENISANQRVNNVLRKSEV